MTNSFSHQSRADRLFWLIPLIAAFFLLLLQGVSIAVSFSGIIETHMPRFPDDYIVFLILLGSLVLSICLFKKPRAVRAEGLSASIIVCGGSVLGILFGQSP